MASEKPLRINRKKFYDGFRAWREVITEDQVKGLNFLLAELERDKAIQLVTIAAYILATVFHETAATMLPIREYGRGRGRKYAKVYSWKLADGSIIEVVYYGRGFVQLTWYDNYKEMNEALPKAYPDLIADFERRTGQKFNLVLRPDQALDPQIAYAILSYGMRNGKFGAKITDHINHQKTDYPNARRSVNVMDKADKIAGYAREFEKILRNSLERDLTAENVSERIDELQKSALNTSEETPANLQVDQNAGAVSGAVPAPSTFGSGQTHIAPPVEQAPVEGGQVAENITNVNQGNTVPPDFKPEEKIVNAPEKDGSTATATRLTIAGITLPLGLSLAIKAVQDIIAQGFVSSQQLGDIAVNFLLNHTKYVFILIGLIIGILIVKKIFKQLSFMLTVWLTARSDTHNPIIVPTVTEQDAPQGFFGRLRYVVTGK